MSLNLVPPFAQTLQLAPPLSVRASVQPGNCLPICRTTLASDHPLGCACLLASAALVSPSGCVFSKMNVVLKVDYNNDGRLEALEIEIGILKLYNIINKRLPGWQNPPTRAKIQEALKLFDEDGNGTLDKHVRTHTWNHQGPYA